MKKDPAFTPTPTIQVIERLFSLIDVLASRSEAISLKEISEKTGLHPSTAHRILNDLIWPRVGSLTGQKRAITAWACAFWSWAIWSRAV